MPAETTAPPVAGTRFAHFEVREPLGSGGMGTVYLAHDTALDRPVALKVLRPEVAGDPSLVERFVLEARAAARVSHPNLTHVYFVGTDGGRPFFAMEYCPGRTLEQAVKEDGPFPLERGLGVLVQAARGLAAAHGGGVVHRDVKPSNLMLLPDGTVKVADFGLAKSLNTDVGLTGGRMLGTPTYMSPEQALGKPVDARTDIYLLGLTGHFLFAGKPPFGSEQVGEVINDQINTPLPSLGDRRPELPAALDHALSRMCAKDPARRPASMAEVVHLLEEARPRPINPAPIVARGAAFTADGVLVLLGVMALAGFDTLVLKGKMPGILQSLFLSSVLASVFLLPELRTGTTAGKALLNLGVVTPGGTRPRPWPMVLRFLIRYPLFLDLSGGTGFRLMDAIFLALQGLALGGGVVCYFFTQGRTLSDLLTRTRVVYRLPRAGRTEP